MTKQAYKIYLEDSDYRKLIIKAGETGFSGRGSVSHFLKFLANNEVIFLDENCKKMLRAMQLK